MRTRPGRWLLVGAAIYAALSLVSAAVPHSGIVRHSVGALYGRAWLLGPPLLLIHQNDRFAVGAYATGTLLVAIGFYVIRRSAEHSPEVGVVTAVIVAAVWCVFGALAYVPFV